MIIDHSNSLHKGINYCRANEFKTILFELFADLVT